MGQEEEAGARRPAGSVAEFAQQLREAADRLTAGWPGLPPSSRGVGGSGSGRPSLPLPPATLSARQLQAVADDIGARRAQVQALRTQLGAFDEQLEALEVSLRPILEWTRTWAQLESAAADLWRPPGSRTEG